MAVDLNREALFSLKPTNSLAREVLRTNTRYVENCINEGQVLSFKATQTSKALPGRMVTFGRDLYKVDRRRHHRNRRELGKVDGEEFINEIKLYDKIHQYRQCAFRLSLSGELILEDLTNNNETYIDWIDIHGQKSEKYSMQGDPRRRVIPMAAAKSIDICLGRNTRFQFLWRVPTDPVFVDVLRRELATIAAANYVPARHMPLKPPNPLSPAAICEKRTGNAPVVPRGYDGRPLRQIHVYSKLGQGGFGEVFKAVDLETGKLWAVKQCKKPSSVYGEIWKADFKREVEEIVMARRHPNILQLEHHQGWAKHAPIQLFFPLCRGSVRKLMADHHNCKRPNLPNVSWMSHFVNQTLSALQYLHNHAEMAHRNIKPDNVLFDYVGGEKVLNFYIGDFGLAESHEAIIARGFAGNIAYMAPELTRRGRAEPKSDIWSFGVMMLEILEYCCIEEGWGTQFSEDSWREKLRAYGAHGTSHYTDESPYPRDRAPNMRVAHSRIKSLLTYGIIEGALTRMLQEDVRRRPSAEEARTDLLRYNWANRRRTSPPVRVTPAPAPALTPIRRRHTQEPPAPLRRRQTQDQRLPQEWGHPLPPDEKLKRRITGGFRHVVAR